MRKLQTVLLASTALGIAACSDSPVDVASPDFRNVNGGAVADEAALVAAFAQASADASIDRIRLEAGATIWLTSPLVFDGSQELMIDGRGATLIFNCLCDGITSANGADLSIQDLTITGDAEEMGNGVVLNVPASATGDVTLSLRSVVIDGAGLYGAVVEDQIGNSDASIVVDLDRVSILNTGFRLGEDDFDGLRVNEGGLGDIRLRVVNSLVYANAGDGIELDEKGPGDVHATVLHSEFLMNGAQPQLPSDLEDAFDIDEAGDGGIFVRIEHSSFNNSFDEGIDLDEEGLGDVEVRLNKVVANGNADENIKISEDADAEDDPTVGGGSVWFQFNNVTANNSNDDGVQIEEFGDGDINGRFVNVTATGNGDDGLEVEQLHSGGGVVRVQASDVEGNADDGLNIDGVELIER